MTRKDYELIAATLRGRCGQGYIDNGTMAAIVADFAMKLMSTNPRFDAERFVNAATTDEVNALVERVPAQFGTHYYPRESVWRPS